MKTNSVTHVRTPHVRLSRLRAWVRIYTGRIGKLPTWQFVTQLPLILVLLIVSIIINQFKKEK